MSAEIEPASLKHTPLYDTHVAAGAKMVPFAGYAMPVQYPMGVLKEHVWCREQAGLFDVSHMGQAILIAADGTHATVAVAIEALVPADIANLMPGQQRYSQLLNDTGGIIDDLMISRPSDPAHPGGLVLVVNASRKDVDFAHIAARLPSGVSLDLRPDNSLLAVQGPASAAVLEGIIPGASQLAFMTTALLDAGGRQVLVSRSGYTGEDGFEIAVAAAHVVGLWQSLAADDRVAPIGLGARDSLRLEAGLCLYGHDIDETTSPVEAALVWSIQKRRREAGGFPGFERIRRELVDGPARRRVGIRPEGRAPAREGTEIQSAEGVPIGTVSSGGFGPSLNAPLAMGYVDAAHAAPGTAVRLVVRGKPLPATVVDMPFVPSRYARKPA